MNLDDQKIKDILLREAYVAAQDIKKAEEYCKRHRSSLVEYLLSEGLITKDLLGQAAAESFGVSYADLNSNPPPHDRVLKIPEELAKKYRAVLFSEDGAHARVTTDNPAQDQFVAELVPFFPSKKVVVMYSLPEDIDATFVYYRKPLETRFAEILKTQKRVAPEIIVEIIEDALVYRASDIHFEPQGKEVLVRFRVDGILQEAGRIAKEYYENILNRVKVQARLRIDEHFSAQDGAMRYETKGRTIDLRVSIVPTLDGEKIAIRILGEYIRGFALGDLGLSPEDQNTLLEAAKKPFGMIVVSGPTGSGKTTTLYALVKVLNRPEVNITTIEDPIEYKIPGVNHIQVNLQTNLTFAKGLRSIARQDPDIVLVGEIRDYETAEIAVNAALTGHLLFSTFHANDAATAIPRLLDMGTEPFLLASTLELVISQRLVRKICESCRYSFSLSVNDITKIFPGAAPFFPKETTFYKGKGCTACNDTGFKGRTAIFELIRITTEIQDLILKKPSMWQVRKLARGQGSRAMFEDGIEKVKSGVTTLEELMRVAAPPQDNK